MTIQTEKEWMGGECYEKFVVWCDECNTPREFEDVSWGDMIEELKEEGWWFTKDKGGEWSHACPDCRGEE